MIEPKYNLYKQKNLFRCVHDIHQHFKAEMSPFHILVQKKCFPHGCIYFKWKCRLLSKRKRCFRNFEKVGRECSNCRYFYEEKIHQYPEFLPENMDFSDFNESFEEFEAWVDTLRNKRIQVEGTVNNVSPELIIRRMNYKSPAVRFLGFLVRFNCGYIDNIPFNDPFYLKISSLTQQQLKIRNGDEMEFLARFEIDRGRFRFIKSGNFTFYERGDQESLQKPDILEQLYASKIYHQQPVECLSCVYGILTDVEDINNGPSRLLVCLKGIKEPEHCQTKETVEKEHNLDGCANPGWKRKSCHKTV